MSPMHARLEKPFAVYQQQSTRNDEGQTGSAYVATGTTVKLLVGSVKPDQTIAFGQVLHEVDHALIQRGPRYDGAKPGDALQSEDGQAFYVHAIEDPGKTGKHTVYFTQQRRDLRLS